MTRVVGQPIAMLSLGLVLSACTEKPSKPLAAADPAAAQQAPRPTVSAVPEVRLVSLESEILGGTRTMRILLPESFEHASSDHTYPIVVLEGSHGEKFFMAVAGIIKHFASVSRMPEAIVVSFVGGTHHAPDVFTNQMWGQGREKLEFDGDPDLFTRHLRKELFPHLEEKFRANKYRIVVGVSGSSVYTLHSFAREADLFSAHVVLAGFDMVGMGYQAGATFIDAFEKRLTDNPVGRLYMAVAADDIKPTRPWVKARNIQKVEQRLGRFRKAGLTLVLETIENEGHYDALVRATLSAIDMLFPKERWSTKFRTLIEQPGNALVNIDRAYGSLSQFHGFTILPRADRWNSRNSLRGAGRILLDAGRKGEAVEVIARWVQYRPRSARALQALSIALEADGRATESIEAQLKAVKIATEHDRENVSRYKERLDLLPGKAKAEPASAGSQP